MRVTGVLMSFIASLLWIKLGLLPWPILYDQTELIKNPGRFKKLRDETNTVAGSNRIVKESDVPKLSYVRAI